MSTQPIKRIVAKSLNHNDIGALTPGMMADVAIFKLGRIGLAGAGKSPVANNIFNVRIVVEDGRVTTVNLLVMIKRKNMLAQELVKN